MIDPWLGARGLAGGLVLVSAMSLAAADEARLVDVRKIWDEAPHNAFTDLLRHEDQWYCVFREGAGHVSPNGAIRVIRSADGPQWQSASRLTSDLGDLRDPKISLAADGRLMLLAAAARRAPDEPRHQSLVWFSDDGSTWSEPVLVGDVNVWLWRVSWHNGVAYGVGYDTSAEKFTRLYRSSDGVQFEGLVDRLFDRGYSNESSILFLPDGTALCLLRRDGKENSAQLGTAQAPYSQWEWKDLGRAIGGPHMLQLPDGRIVAAGRLYDGKVRTALSWLNAAEGKLEEFLALPSGGDTSYPGLVFHDGLLWVSYYDSREGKTSIYLARVKLP